MDCDAETLQTDAERSSISDRGRTWSGGGFVAQEMEGIGGSMTMKRKVLVRVGAEVDDGDDEDSETPSLDLELKGERRSWCAWCERVIPSLEDGWDKEWEMGGY